MAAAILSDATLVYANLEGANLNYAALYDLTDVRGCDTWTRPEPRLPACRPAGGGSISNRQMAHFPSGARTEGWPPYATDISAFLASFGSRRQPLIPVRWSIAGNTTTSGSLCQGDRMAARVRRLLASW